MRRRLKILFLKPCCLIIALLMRSHGNSWRKSKLRVAKFKLGNKRNEIMFQGVVDHGPVSLMLKNTHFYLPTQSFKICIGTKTNILGIFRNKRHFLSRKCNWSSSELRPTQQEQKKMAIDLSDRTSSQLVTSKWKVDVILKSHLE